MNRTDHELYDAHMAAASKALTSANNHPTQVVQRFYFSQIALANVAFARELREAGQRA